MENLSVVAGRRTGPPVDLYAVALALAQADPGPADEVVRPADREAAEEVDAVLEIEDGDTTLFEAAIGAFNAGEFARAESLFLEEAERALDIAPQRAAIAFRQAALAAQRTGDVDGSDHWMRLAGREYLRVSEDTRTPLPFIREAAVMAAKCFLSVENLHVATKGLRRAQAIESVLRADDDLMAAGTAIPFRRPETSEPRSPAPDATSEERLSAVRESDRRDPSTSGAPEFQVIHSDGPVGTRKVRERRSGWGRRRRDRVANNDVA
jgi:hypothetical protein